MRPGWFSAPTGVETDFVLMDGPLLRSTARSAPLYDHTGATVLVMPVWSDAQ